MTLLKQMVFCKNTDVALPMDSISFVLVYGWISLAPTYDASA